MPLDPIMRRTNWWVKPDEALIVKDSWEVANAAFQLYGTMTEVRAMTYQWNIADGGQFRKLINSKNQNHILYAVTTTDS